ncbi:unnamed protein product, partial [marine sediment metagenome]
FYLIKTIKGLSKDSPALTKGLNDITASLRGLGGTKPALSKLKALHKEALKTLPKFKDRTAKDIKKEQEAELTRFLLRFSQKQLASIYGFQEILIGRKLKSPGQGLTRPLVELNPEDLDTLFRAYQNTKNYPKDFEEAQDFSGFIERILLPLKGYIEKDYSALLTEGVPENILQEISGHFKRAAGAFASSQKPRESSMQKSEIAYVNLLAKKDMIRFIRFADGAQCCLSSNKKTEGLAQTYEDYMGAAFMDKGLLVFQVHTKDRPLGFMLMHLAADKDKNLISASLQLYIKKGYHSKVATSNIWRKTEKI